MSVTEKEITLRLSLSPYRRLQELAQQAGKTPESLTREIVERALGEPEVAPSAPSRTARQILEASGRARPLSPALQRRIIPDVTLEEVRAALGRANGPSLSDIIRRQRDIDS